MPTLTPRRDLLEVKDTFSTEDRFSIALDSLNEAQHNADKLKFYDDVRTAVNNGSDMDSAIRDTIGNNRANAEKLFGEGAGPADVKKDIQLQAIRRDALPHLEAAYQELEDNKHLSREQKSVLRPLERLRHSIAHPEINPAVSYEGMTQTNDKIAALENKHGERSHMTIVDGFKESMKGTALAEIGVADLNKAMDVQRARVGTYTGYARSAMSKGLDIADADKGSLNSRFEARKDLSDNRNDIVHGEVESPSRVADASMVSENVTSLTEAVQNVASRNEVRTNNNYQVLNTRHDAAQIPKEGQLQDYRDNGSLKPVIEVTQKQRSNLEDKYYLEVADEVGRLEEKQANHLKSALDIESNPRAYSDPAVRNAKIAEHNAEAAKAGDKAARMGEQAEDIANSQAAEDIAKIQSGELPISHLESIDTSEIGEGRSADWSKHLASTNSSPEALIGKWSANRLGITPEAYDNGQRAAAEAGSQDTRVYHDTDHFRDLQDGAGKVSEALTSNNVTQDNVDLMRAAYNIAGRDHDVVYINSDKQMTAAAQETAGKFVTLNSDGSYSINANIPKGSSADIAMDVFGYKPGQKLEKFGGQNEFLSAVHSLEVNQGMATDGKFAVASLIESSIPFRGHDATEKLFDRLVSSGVSTEQAKAMAISAADFANRDVGNFKGEYAKFEENTLKLMQEAGVDLSSPEGIAQKAALDEGFLKGTAESVRSGEKTIYQSFMGTPSDGSIDMMNNVALRNMDRGVDSMRAIQAAAAITHAKGLDSDPYHSIIDMADMIQEDFTKDEIKQMAEEAKTQFSSDEPVSRKAMSASLPEKANRFADRLIHEDGGILGDRFHMDTSEFDRAGQDKPATTRRNSDMPIVTGPETGIPGMTPADNDLLPSQPRQTTVAPPADPADKTVANDVMKARQQKPAGDDVKAQQQQQNQANMGGDAPQKQNVTVDKSQLLVQAVGHGDNARLAVSLKDGSAQSRDVLDALAAEGGIDNPRDTESGDFEIDPKKPAHKAHFDNLVRANPHLRNNTEMAHIAGIDEVERITLNADVDVAKTAARSDGQTTIINKSGLSRDDIDLLRAKGIKTDGVIRVTEGKFPELFEKLNQDGTKAPAPAFEFETSQAIDPANANKSAGSTPIENYDWKYNTDGKTTASYELDLTGLPADEAKALREATGTDKTSDQIKVDYNPTEGKFVNNFDGKHPETARAFNDDVLPKVVGRDLDFQNSSNSVDLSDPDLAHGDYYKNKPLIKDIGARAKSPAGAPTGVAVSRNNGGEAVKVSFDSRNEFAQKAAAARQGAKPIPVVELGAVSPFATSAKPSSLPAAVSANEESPRPKFDIEAERATRKETERAEDLAKRLESIADQAAEKRAAADGLDKPVPIVDSAVVVQTDDGPKIEVTTTSEGSTRTNTHTLDQIEVKVNQFGGGRYEGEFDRLSAAEPKPDVGKVVADAKAADTARENAQWEIGGELANPVKPTKPAADTQPHRPAGPPEGRYDAKGGTYNKTQFDRDGLPIEISRGARVSIPVEVNGATPVTNAEASIPSAKPKANSAAPNSAPMPIGANPPFLNPEVVEPKKPVAADVDASSKSSLKKETTVVADGKSATPVSSAAVPPPAAPGASIPFERQPGDPKPLEMPVDKDAGKPVRAFDGNEAERAERAAMDPKTRAQSEAGDALHDMAQAAKTNANEALAKTEKGTGVKQPVVVDAGAVPERHNVKIELTTEQGGKFNSKRFTPGETQRFNDGMRGVDGAGVKSVDEGFMGKLNPDQQTPSQKLAAEKAAAATPTPTPTSSAAEESKGMRINPELKSKRGQAGFVIPEMLGQGGGKSAGGVPKAPGGIGKFGAPSVGVGMSSYAIWSRLQEGSYFRDAPTQDVKQEANKAMTADGAALILEAEAFRRIKTGAGGVNGLGMAGIGLSLYAGYKDYTAAELAGDGDMASRAIGGTAGGLAGGFAGGGLGVAVGGALSLTPLAPIAIPATIIMSVGGGLAGGHVGSELASELIGDKLQEGFDADRREQINDNIWDMNLMLNGSDIGAGSSAEAVAEYREMTKAFKEAAYEHTQIPSEESLAKMQDAQAKLKEFKPELTTLTPELAAENDAALKEAKNLYAKEANLYNAGVGRYNVELKDIQEKFEKSGDEREFQKDQELLARDYKDYFKNRGDNVTSLEQVIEMRSRTGMAHTTNDFLNSQAEDATEVDTIAELAQQDGLVPEDVEKLGAAIGGLNDKATSADTMQIANKAGELNVEERDIPTIYNPKDRIIIDGKVVSEPKMWESREEIREGFVDDIERYGKVFTNDEDRRAHIAEKVAETNIPDFSNLGKVTKFDPENYQAMLDTVSPQRAAEIQKKSEAGALMDYSSDELAIMHGIAKPEDTELGDMKKLRDFGDDSRLAVEDMKTEVAERAAAQELKEKYSGPFGDKLRDMDEGAVKTPEQKVQDLKDYGTYSPAKIAEIQAEEAQAQMYAKILGIDPETNGEETQIAEKEEMEAPEDNELASKGSGEPVKSAGASVKPAVPDVDAAKAEESPVMPVVADKGAKAVPAIANLDKPKEEKPAEPKVAAVQPEKEPAVTEAPKSEDIPVKTEVVSAETPAELKGAETEAKAENPKKSADSEGVAKEVEGALAVREVTEAPKKEKAADKKEETEEKEQLAKKKEIDKKLDIEIKDPAMIAALNKAKDTGVTKDLEKEKLSTDGKDQKEGEHVNEPHLASNAPAADSSQARA